MLLSGIKTGKKKTKKRTADEQSGASSVPETLRQSPKALDNQAIAAKFKAQLAAGKSLQPSSASTAAVSNQRVHSAVNELEELQRRGRIQGPESDKNDNVDTNAEENVLVYDIPSARANQAVVAVTEETSLQDLVRHERQTQGTNVYDHESRTLLRLGKKRKVKQRTLDGYDSDEQIAQQVALLEKVNPTKAKDQAKEEQRRHHRALAQHDQQQSMTKHTWWWMESSNFPRHLLLAIGKAVALVMVPDVLCLDGCKCHLYLVPIIHVESLASCQDPTVWDEIYRFQQAIRDMFNKTKSQDGDTQKEDKKKKKKKRKQYELICFETVLPQHSLFWQTKLHICVVSRQAWLDADLYFRQALQERVSHASHTSGTRTHSAILQTSRQKKLPSVVPGNFGYLYVQYFQPNTVHNSQHDGLVQVLEDEEDQRQSSRQTQDWALDILAGILDVDPLRMKGKARGPAYAKTQKDMEKVGDFLKKWKDYDWTRELDG